MNFFELVKKRHSIRAYKKKPVPDDLLNKVLECATSAPSAGNLQAYEMYIIRDERLKQELAEAAWNQQFISEAPISIIFCANLKRSAKQYGRRGEELYCIQDATIAAAYLQLAAVELGLATVWVGAFDESNVKEILALPAHLRPIAIIPLGYPDESPSENPRKALKDIVHSFDKS